MITGRPAWTRIFILLLAIIIASRIGLAIVTAYHPITNEIGKPASVNHTAPSSDFNHYLAKSKLYFDVGFIEVLKAVAKINYGMDVEIKDETRFLISPGHLEMSPPVFPALIWIFEYKKGNTLPLAILFIGFSIVVTSVWAKWMEKNGMPLAWILLFVFLPHTAWFTINLGSDLLFYCTFTVFFLVYYSNIEKKKRIAYSFLAMGLCIFTRPTGASLMVFFLVDQFLAAKPENRRRYLIYLFLALVVMSPAILFLFPYFLSVVNSSMLWPFFGIVQPDYLAGIYENLPRVLDLPLSWLTLFLSKIVYVFGLRPSYGDVSVPVFLFRALPGLIFLPGFLHLMMRGKTSEKVLVLSMLLPVFIGPAQDRYLLPLQPLLIYHAWLLSRPLQERMTGRLKTAYPRLFDKQTR